MARTAHSDNSNNHSFDLLDYYSCLRSITVQNQNEAAYQTGDVYTIQ